MYYINILGQFFKSRKILAVKYFSMESAQEFLSKKGFRKVHQLNQRYNLTIGELIEFLNEYAYRAIRNGSSIVEKRIQPGINVSPPESSVSKQANT